jgi:hypothetical protein
MSKYQMGFAHKFPFSTEFVCGRGNSCATWGAGTGVQLESYSLPAGKNAETRLRLGESLHTRG